MAISGDTAIVGARSGGGIGRTGAAYIFERNQGGPGNWGEIAKLTGSASTSQAFFGAGVATNGATVIAGAPSAGWIQSIATN